MSQAPPGAGSSGGGSKDFGPGQAIGGASDLFSIISGLGQSSAESGVANELQGDLGTLESQGSGLYGNYAANAEPGLNAIISGAPSRAAGYQNSASGAYGAEGAYGQALGASPYPGAIQSEGGQFMTYPDASIGAEGANAAELENWQGIGKQELGEATTVASNAALSNAATMKAQMGGVPNAGALSRQLNNNAASAGMQTGLALGSQAESQELGAKEAAGQEYGAMAGQQLAQVSGEVGATEAAGQAYQGAMEGAGGLEGAAGQGYAGLSGQELSELESALGEEGSMAGVGLGAEGQATNGLEQLFGDMSTQSNPFASGISGLMSLFPLAAAA